MEKIFSKPWFKILSIFIGILIVIGLFGNLYLLLKKQNPPVASVVPTPVQIIATPTLEVLVIPTLIPGITTNWKTYTNDFAKFTLKYPNSLTFTEKSFSNENKQVIFSGNEGKLMISYSTSSSPGWGGRCEHELQNITFLGELKKVCHSSSYLAFLYAENPNGKSRVHIDAYFNQPYERSETTIMQIFSTFKFLE